MVTLRSGFQRCGHQLNPSRDLRGVGVRWVTQHMLSSCTCTSLPDVQGSGYVQIPCSIPALRQYVASTWPGEGAFIAGAAVTTLGSRLNIRSHVWNCFLFPALILSQTPFPCAPAVITTSLSRGIFVVTRRTVFSAVVISSTRLETFEAWGFDG